MLNCRLCEKFVLFLFLLVFWLVVVSCGMIFIWLLIVGVIFCIWCLWIVWNILIWFSCMLKMKLFLLVRFMSCCCNTIIWSDCMSWFLLCWNRFLFFVFMIVKGKSFLFRFLLSRLLRVFMNWNWSLVFVISCILFLCLIFLVNCVIWVKMLLMGVSWLLIFWKLVVVSWWLMIIYIRLSVWFIFVFICWFLVWWWRRLLVWRNLV